MAVNGRADARFIALGAGGFGRSGTRAALRDFFEVDRRHIVLAAVQGLARQGAIERGTLAKAIKLYGVDPERLASWEQ